MIERPVNMYKPKEDNVLKLEAFLRKIEKEGHAKNQPEKK